MDLNNVMKGKAIGLGTIIILITFLVSGSSTSILPFVFFTGILMGIIKNDEILEAAVAGFLAALFGSVISTVINLILVYMSYGQAFVGYMFSSTLYSVLFYLIVGVVGGVIGYYVSKELEI